MSCNHSMELPHGRSWRRKASEERNARFAKQEKRWSCIIASADNNFSVLVCAKENQFIKLILSIDFIEQGEKKNH